MQALGHLLASRALMDLKRPDQAAAEGNQALEAMRAAGAEGGVLVPEFELTQGEFLLRTGQREKGHAMLRAAASKLLQASGPDAWVQTLFSLEAVVRMASEQGDWALAEDFAGQMRELDPAYAGSQYALARVAEHRGNAAAARALYAEAVRKWADADADFTEARQARSRLASLSGAKEPARPE
jgi:tetratricopeptide (TPR) repeat protein